MKPIPVYPKPFRTFDTAAEAFMRPETHPLRPKLDGFIEALKGTQLTKALWTDVQFAFQFSNGLWLNIALDEHDIYWSVEKVTPDALLDVPPKPQVFDWGGSIGVRTTDISSLISGRIGGEFANLCVNDDFFYVYFRRKMILCFSVVFRADTHVPMLSVFEDD